MILFPLRSPLPTVTLRRQAQRIGKSGFGELASALKPLRRRWEIFFLKGNFAQHERRPNRPITSILLRLLEQIFPRCSCFGPLLLQIRGCAFVVGRKFGIKLSGQRRRRPARSGIERSASLFVLFFSFCRVCGLVSCLMHRRIKISEIGLCWVFCIFLCPILLLVYLYCCFVCTYFSLISTSK